MDGAVQLPTDTVRRLVLVRAMYTEALSESRRPDPAGLLSVLRLHDAIELFLALAVAHRNVYTKRQDFSAFWDALAGVVEGGLGYRAQMDRLNKARVGLKHYGNLPSRDTLDELRSAVDAFLRDATPRVFEIEFDSISLLDLIVESDARRQVREAEELFDSGDGSGSAASLALAFLHG
jgi:hypothetical protein